MSSPTKPRQLLCILAIAAALTVTGCRQQTATQNANPTADLPAAPAQTAPEVAPVALPSTQPVSVPPPKPAGTVSQGEVWPIAATNNGPVADPGPGPAVLRQMRTGLHGNYERLVLEFSAAFGSANVHYVPIVREDPSYQVVPLAGHSFLQVSVQGAVARYNAVPITPYTGPNTINPGYPTIKQVSISGDFEAVLSFGIGLDRTAGFRISRLRAPDRLVIDIAERPSWQMWPDNSLAAAREVQAGYEQGHQTWRGNPLDVVRLYANQVYGWTDPTITPVTATSYRLSPFGPDSVTVQTTRPFTTGIVEISNTR